MKILGFLILTVLAALPALAQDIPEQIEMAPPSSIDPTNLGYSAYFTPVTIPSGAAYAEAITPDIQALASALQDDPLKIFKYVHDHIKFVLYFGSLKGAELTLLEQSGNDLDQCALLMALLRAAGYSPTYYFSMVKFPYQATDGTQNDLMHWWGVTMPNTNWLTTSNFLTNLAGLRGFGVMHTIDSDDYGVQHTWVSLTVGGTNYLLDPSFKVSLPITAAAGFSLTNGMGGTGITISNALLAVAGGTDNGTNVYNLNEAALRGTLTGYTTNLLAYLQSNYPNASVEDVLGGSRIVPYTNTDLSRAMIYTTLDNPFGDYPELTWSNDPTSFMSKFSITIGSTNETWYFPQLEGEGLSLSFDSAGTATLWLGNSVVVQTSNTGSGSTINVTLAANHPFGWNATTDQPYDGGYEDQSWTKTYQRTSANYAIMYAFEPSVKWLNAQEQQLDLYESEGYANTSPQVVNATLNVMGMEWMVQTRLAQDILCQQKSLLPEYQHRIGRMAQESGAGYYVDIYLQMNAIAAATGNGAQDQQNHNEVFDVNSYFGSALEHCMIQQFQDSNLLASSTVKILQLANTNQYQVFLANSTNWSAVQGQLTGYGSSVLSGISANMGPGYYYLLPQNGAISVAGSGSYTGYGYVQFYSSGNNRSIGMNIGGIYNGGYVSQPAAQINPAYTEDTVINQPAYFETTPVSTPAPPAADPIDTADGTFQVGNTDLSVGQAEPKGITLSRYYNGTRRLSNLAGMADGWIHNYCITANNVAAPQAGLGQTTPAQMAPMLVATCAALNLYNTQPDAGNWEVTALIAKWAVDQLIQNGVSVNLGKDNLQFVQQPNGVFTPPANCTATLMQTNSAYVLQMRHGNRFNFNVSGYLTNIVDQYGNALNLTYNTSNWVNTVKDWKGRTLTFNYGGTPERLTNVSDGTRSVSYGYSTTYNPQGDLTSFVDPEGKTSTYAYDTNHEITATYDALSHLVVSNVYDGDGHVNIQYTEGLANKEWQIFWSGWQTITADPAGGQQTYLYDDMGRLVGTEDALSNLTQTFYDGQNHIVETVSPLNETNLSFYDGNNNLTNSTDPLGFTTRYIYDNNNSLIKIIDPRGNSTTFGYNSEFSLIGQTNGAGDYVNYVYNTSGSSPGTLASRTDSGGTANYTYDGFGQLASAGYSGIGTNTFANSYAGDVTNQMDGRGFATVFQYNARRQLTNTIAPTNLITSIAYDAVGNVSSALDARGNITSETWSATRKLLSTTLPAIPAGTPVITSSYDNRDWLTGTVDPLENSTAYTNDLDGRQISETDPLSRTTTVSYDNDGRTLATANPAQEITRQTWDAKGELINLIDGAGHTSPRIYDQAGDQIVLTNRNGNPWHFYYDAANRLTNTVSPLGRSTSVTLNHQGLPILVTEPLQQITNSYDAKGRLTNRTDSVGGILYSYDADDNCTRIAGSGLTNSWAYDAYNRVSSYTDANGNLIQYRYDANGNLTNLVYPGNRNVYYTYDSENHMTGVTDWSQRLTTMSYDLDGRLTSVTRPNGTYRTIGYDSAGEVTNVLEQMANSLPIALMRFAWNPNSTMQWEFLAPQPHTNVPPSRSMSYNADNQLTYVDGYSVNVDNDGNLTYGPLTNDASATTYTYDARNRLQNVNGVTNNYDAANNRIGQTYGTNSVLYVVNPNAKLPQVLMRIKNGLTNYYVYGAGLLYQITEAPTGTNTLTYHYDYRGSTIALTGDNGLVTDRMEYSLYGTMTYHLGTSDTPFLFNGQFCVMSDPDGLLYMRARYYSPFLCRFLNPDPTGFKGGLNFYQFANGNPVSYRDPTGLGAVGDNQNLSWLTGNNATPSDLSSPFNLGTGDSGLNYDSTTLAVGTLGLSQSIVQYGSGTATIGDNGAFYQSGWGGNQYVSTAKIGNIADKVALPLAFVSVGVDVYGLSQGSITPTKFTVNTGFTGLGFVAPPYGAIATGEYFLIDTAYPGGWPAFIQNSRPAAASFINSEIIVP